MAQDDDMRDDSTQQEFNDTDRAEETQHSDSQDTAADTRGTDTQRTDEELDAESDNM